jgi:hypothetical protein
MLGEQSVEVLEELGKATGSIDDAGVVLGARGDEEDDVDLRSLGSDGQAVEERVGRIAVRLIRTGAGSSDV